MCAFTACIASPTYCWLVHNAAGVKTLEPLKQVHANAENKGADLLGVVEEACVCLSLPLQPVGKLLLQLCLLLLQHAQ